jgi:hypothetical protein
MKQIKHFPLEPDTSVCVGVPSAASVFITKKKFVVDQSYDTKAPIRELRLNFVNRFLAGHGKKEVSTPEVDIRCLRVYRPATHVDALKKIGGAVMAETTLHEVHWLICIQRHLRPLEQLPHRTNIFFVKDMSGELCVVSLVWPRYFRGWVIDAMSISDYYDIPVQSRIFYRAPQLLSALSELSV